VTQSKARSPPLAALIRRVLPYTQSQIAQVWIRDLYVSRNPGNTQIVNHRSYTSSLSRCVLVMVRGGYGLALGDLNGDGYPDVVAARSEAPNVMYFSGK
jgi:hypothetical protein